MSAALAGGGSSPPPAPCKGKAKMDDEAEAEGAGKMCGICYVDGRRAIPGELDCCAHFFCFVCIMAWGRVESRCPFCKARFRTIRRPPVPGRFPDERVVSVPERNQVYHPQGNGSSTVGRDPYSDIVCTVCNASRDDELLLLCELCDSAAHTYCAGLGNVVPEGDWFCKDCAIIREEQLRWQAENEGQGSQAEFEINIDVPRAEPVAAPPVSEAVDEEYAPDRTDVRGGSNSMDDPVPSIYDIVGEDFPTCAGIRMGPRRNAPSQGSSPDGSQGPVLTKAQDGGLAAYHARIRQEVERARTLRNSRNLDKRVRELRENWAALRAGSVGFAPRVPNAVNNRNSGAATSVQPQMPSPAETSTSLGNGKKVLHKDTRDARKAWKKLEMAKTSGGRKISSKPASLDCTPSFSMGNRSTYYSPIDTILGHKNGNLPNKVTRQNNANCGQGTKMESTPPTKDSGECHRLSEDSHARVHERMISFQNRINQESLNGNVASSIHGQHVDQPLASSCSTGRSEKFKSGTLHLLKCSSSSGQSPVPKSQKLEPISGSQSNMMVNAEEPLSAATTNEIGSAAATNEIGSAAATNEIGSAATTEVTKSSRPERHEHKRKHSSEKSKDEGSKRSRSACKTAKSEISSLAIRELKLLKIDKTHGSEKFKEVARTATHTVLAACGFEHSPSQSLALPRPVCKHSPKVKQLNSSGLADSCRECLRSSVKEAISLALSGRHMDQTSASC